MSDTESTGFFYSDSAGDRIFSTVPLPDGTYTLMKKTTFGAGHHTIFAYSLSDSDALNAAKKYLKDNGATFIASRKLLNRLFGWTSSLQ